LTTAQKGEDAALLLGATKHVAGISVRGWTATAYSELKMNHNLVAGSQGASFHMKYIPLIISGRGLFEALDFAGNSQIRFGGLEFFRHIFLMRPIKCILHSL
jgi:hypothetical protein